MSTIRQRLTWRLLLGWTLLLVTGLGYRLTAALNGDACLALTLSGPLKLQQPDQRTFTLEKPTETN